MEIISEEGGRERADETSGVGMKIGIWSGGEHGKGRRIHGVSTISARDLSTVSWAGDREGGNQIKISDDSPDIHLLPPSFPFLQTSGAPASKLLSLRL